MLVLVAIAVHIVKLADLLMKLKLATCLINHHATRRVCSGGMAPCILTSTLYEDEQSVSVFACFTPTESVPCINLGEDMLGTGGWGGTQYLFPGQV